jgi:hypothetical protein
LLLFALIGYIVDSRREKNDLFRKTSENIDEESLENLVVPEGKKLSDMVSKSASLDPTTKNVVLTDESIKSNAQNAGIVNPESIISNPTIENQNTNQVQ